MATTYQVIDIQTGKILSTYKNREAAYRTADRKDAAYGEVRHIVQPIFANEVTV